MTPLCFKTINTPVGLITLVASEHALLAISWGDELLPNFRKQNIRPDQNGENPILKKTEEQLNEYFAGQRKDFDLPCNPIGTDFQKTAWEELTKIPYGQTITYGEQAKRLGNPKSSRAVGAANGKNPISIVIPCHRVVGSTGKLTGFAGGLSAKQRLLEIERGANRTQA